MTYIIAEAGVNHCGSVEHALRLVNAARASGADAVKFQAFSAEKLHRPGLAELELSHADFERIYRACRGIEFLCTPFDVDALNFLADLGMRRIKIGSGSLTDHELLRVARHTGLPIILSTGMATEANILDALNVIIDRVTLLHCTSAYPCPLVDVNLACINTLRRTFGMSVGYSDHTAGITVAIAAAAMGATVLEKHLTLDRRQHGPDHRASIEPKEFSIMVAAIRHVELAMGDGVKRPMPSEKPTREIWGR